MGRSQVEVLRLRDRLLLGWRTVAGLLLAAALIVFGCSLANASALEVARLLEHAEDTAVKMALGATPSRLLVEVLIGQLPTLWVATPLAVLTAGICARPLSQLLPLGWEQAGARWLPISVGAVALSAVACTITVLLVAARLMRARPADLLRADAPGSGTWLPARSRLLAVLLSAQALLGVVGVSGAAYASLALLRAERGLGLSLTGTYAAELFLGSPPALVEASAAEIDEALRTDDPSASFAMATHIPVVHRLPSYYVEVLGQTAVSGGGGRALPCLHVTPRFFSVLGVPVVAGRTLSAGPAGGVSEVVVSRALAEDLGGPELALGRTVKIAGRALSIVGVSENVKMVAFEEEPARALFLSLSAQANPEGQGDLSVLVRTSRGGAKAEAALLAIRRLWPQAQVSSAVALEVLLSEPYQQVRARLTVLVALTALAVVAALFGVGATTRDAMVRERRLWGLRAALGATPAQLLGAILLSAGKPLAIGGLLGALVASLSVSILERAYGLSLVTAPEAALIGLAALGLATVLTVAAASAAYVGQSPAALLKQ